MSETVAETRILDVTKPQKVSYCIPLWLRDEQVRINIETVKTRIEAHYDRRSDPVAIVCFGPSLNETWEKIREFKYTMTCSGAHKFLIDRGIIPTWHAEVDPREHKIKLVDQPHKDVEYLIASTCHPKLFEYLKDYNVKLWHVFDPGDEGLRLLPPGEWALTGGCGVGLRAMALARFMGFTDQHIFGMDGCEGASGSHASEHPNAIKKFCTTEYKGVIYKTTPALLEAARQTWYELNSLKDVDAKFYGEGLVQAMAKDYVREVREDVLAFNKPELISPKFRELNARLHRDRLEFGVGGGKHADTVIKLAESMKTNSILDYGCGKGYLAKAIPFPIWEYDPAIPGKDMSPRPSDIVVCTDVLEHIEPDKLMFVLDDLRRCVKKVGYFTICTGPAVKTYADGRNTHLIQQGIDWWRKRLSKFFHVAKIFPVGMELHVIVGPKQKG